jgi:acyl carrier protein
VIPTRIVDILGLLSIDASEASGATTLGDEGLAMDSQEIAELLCLIEKRFGVAVPHGYLRRSTTIDQVVRLLEGSPPAPEGARAADSHRGSEL